MKATKDEVRVFKEINYQREALLELLGLIKERQLALWEKLEEKYKLDKKQLWKLDHKTREIKQSF